MINVTCAIILKDDKILVAQRNANMDLPYKWEFPGGKIEEGESEEECLIREIKEELNIYIELKKRLKARKYSYNHKTINLIPYIAKYVSGNLNLSEHKAVVWLRKEELESLDWAMADDLVLNDYLNDSYK